MNKRFIIIIYIILIIIFFKLLYNTGTNLNLINKYNNGEYDSNQSEKLTHFNCYQSYVANYNYGNILYQNGAYESAIEEYKKALKGRVPKDKRCRIRVNYALAICKTVEINEKDQESIDNAIKTYESAEDILAEEGCADKYGNNGHDQEAQQLNEDIQREIDRLRNLKKEDSNQKEKIEEKEKKETNEEMETIEKKIQNIKQEAAQDQRDLESKFNNYNKDIKTNDKNW